MNSSKDLIYFINDLEAEKNVLYAFIEILKEEERALVHDRSNEIDYLTSEKSRLLEELQRFDRRRDEHLKQQGIIPEKTTMSNWIAKNCTKYPNLKNLWIDLIELAKAAQQLNRTNGLIINNYLQHNLRACAALHCAAGNVSLYGPRGQVYF